MPDDGTTRTRRRVAVVTGSRAEFGLLKPVMRAVEARPDLELLVIAAGSHLISPAQTFREVKAEFEVADSIPMQRAGQTTRADDAEALGRGIARFTRSFSLLEPDWVVVLGDRIEAFAAASAASVGGWALAHIHGGDRAEGVADEAMRHAITKLAHLHLLATELSGQRIERMGERPEHIRVVGSPAIDDLESIEPLDDERFAQLGKPDTVFLMHPIGRTDEQEEHGVTEALRAVADRRVFALGPNHDAGRRGVARAIEAAQLGATEHLPRSEFVGLLKRIAPAGVLVGNSSAGLIECAALGVRTVDIGPRQAGRERADNVTDAQGHSESAIRDAITLAMSSRPSGEHHFGDGQTGERVAAALVEIEPHDDALLRKRCAY